MAQIASRSSADRAQQTLFVLVPLREQALLIPPSRDSPTKNSSLRDNDYLVVQDNDLYAGRVELLQAMWKACACSDASTGKGSTRNKCSACLSTNRWAKRFLPKKLFWLKSYSSNSLQLRVPSASKYHIHHCIRIIRRKTDHHEAADRTHAEVAQPLHERIIDSTDDEGKDNGWFGPVELQSDDIIQLQNPESCQEVMEFRVVALLCARSNTNTSSRRNVTETSGGPPIVRDSIDGNDSTNRQRNQLYISQRQSSTTMKKEMPTGSNRHLQPNKRPRRSAESSKKTAVASEPKSCQPILYFLRKGTDMVDSVIDGEGGLKQHVIDRGASVVDEFDRNHPPTHIVISSQLHSERVPAALGFESMQELVDFMRDRQVHAVQRRWASKGNSRSKPPFDPVTMEYKFRGLRTSQSSSILISNVQAESRPKVRNRDLAEIFRRLSKLYQLAPIDGSDEWRSYSFMVTCGRMRNLDFEITRDPLVLDRVRQIKGFADATMEVVEDFLETGTCERLERLERDPKRQAMIVMMKIWGVGRAKAAELVEKGYKSVEEVRKAVTEGKLTMNRNQYIGLLGYEDIQEEMERSEVERIFAIVDQAFKRRYSEVECCVMGSYRRGHQTCGDVDILVTHPHYSEEVPPNALGQVVDDLRDCGHIAHHLTFISGMDHRKFESLPPQAANKLSKPNQYGRGRNKNEKLTSSSYMGVFWSPVVKGKLRRIDIKFYPYSQRIFAGLYFTGNGYFNRAMRLWSKQKMLYHLDDHGLYKHGTSERVLEANTEEEVFEKLGLAYKKVEDRNFFDDVHSTDGKDSALQLDVTPWQLNEEAKAHPWIS